MSTLLEQAIVDAKSLKEAALKNAEHALLEKYSEDIKSAVETLLEAEGDEDPMAELGGDDMGMGMGEEEVEDTLPDITAAVTDGEDLCPCPDTDEEINIDFDQLKAAVDAEEASLEDDGGALGDDLLGGLPDDADEPGLELQEVFMLEEEEEEGEQFDVCPNCGSDNIANEDGPDEDNRLPVTCHDCSHQWTEQLEEACGAYKRNDEELEEEIELDEGIRDWWNNLRGKNAEEPEPEPEPDPTGVDYAKLLRTLYPDGPPVDPFSPEGSAEEEELVREEIQDMIQEILHVDHAPQPSGTIGGYGYTNDAEIEAEVNANLARQLADTEAKEEIKAYKKQTKDLQESVRKHKTKTKRYAQAVNTLKEKLDEMALSNAKLLYTNKVLNSDSLNERQSKKIVEAISNANSVNEAKVIYETLQSTVGSVAQKQQPKSLSEAVSRKPAFLPRREPKPAPSSEMTRWHVLAGLGDKK